MHHDQNRTITRAFNFSFSGRLDFARIGGLARKCTALLSFGMLLSGALAQNAIVLENQKAGNPASEWDISGAGDLTIQGFATDISVNKGETVHFKVATDAVDYRLDIYRLGYYGGLGARLVASISPSVALPQIQPDPITDDATGLVDCGNWTESASWPVPSDATSGIYIAKLVRSDTGGASHIAFVVRDDNGGSNLLFQTSDETWQAYNLFGGNSLYLGAPAGRAYKVSYNRPFLDRDDNNSVTWLFSSEYPMIRWIEKNGYDVSYFTGVDSDRHGNLLLQHKAFLSVGHDEYWSGQQRANVEAARNAGVHLAFFSGNEIFWKTRWEQSIDGSGTPYRTLVCYKETQANAKIDPSPEWTGTWRDPRFSPPADGGRPENSLTGTSFIANSPRNDAITVPSEYSFHRFWRNTGVDTLAAGDSAVFPDGTLGYEWDESPDNGFRPAGLVYLSETNTYVGSLLRDYGANYGYGYATHKLSLYRHNSGALVFGAGTVQWAWGLDSTHDGGNQAPSAVMQQATVNLFADMGAQPETLQTGLVSATASSDNIAPISTILTPTGGSTFPAGISVQITGTATDTLGHVAAVEISTDSGSTWHPAVGRSSWSYTWTPLESGIHAMLSRAVDDSGNIETPGVGTTVTIQGTAASSIWAGTLPTLIDTGPDSPVEVGVKFKSDVEGMITGIRFFKAVANTGTHIGSLWSSTGTLLATATFTNESSTGWQQVVFASPVAISANTVYVASYHSNGGHISGDPYYFQFSDIGIAPLHALFDVASGGNGVFAYSDTSTFPDQSWNASNYWVDVAFQAGPAPTLSSITITPLNPNLLIGAVQQFTAVGTYSNASTLDITNQVSWSSTAPAGASVDSVGLATALSAGSAAISATLGDVSNSINLTVQTSPLSIATNTLPSATTGVFYSCSLAGTGGTLPYSWSITVGALPSGLVLNGSTGAISGTPTVAGTFNFTVAVVDSSNPVQTVTKPLSITIASVPLASIWSSSSAPVRADGGPDNSVELGVRFRSDVTGTITAVRFYKSTANTGTHVGSLWSAAGTLLATATFTGETASGWQQVTFSSPVPITANTVYVASYHTTTGHFAADLNAFASAGVDNAPLHALANDVSGGNGVYAYAASTVFPSLSWSATNYWVDVVFQAGPPPALASISVTPSAPSILVGATQQFTATGTYSDGSTQNITSQVIWTSSATSSASISSAGLATGVSPGSSTITASLASSSGTANLTVQSQPIAISTSTLASGFVSSSYTASLSAAGGVSPYTWSLSSGFLPAGLTLNAGTGAITGTPTSTGTFSFTVQVTDAQTVAQSATKALAITVTAPLTSIAVTPTNPTVTVGSTQQFTATATYADATTQNITSQVSWASSSTAQATIKTTGLATGVKSGSTNITATLGSVTNGTLLTVQAAPISITTASLPGGQLTASYTATLGASGGSVPYDWAMFSGALPSGLVLNGSTGAITGTPTVAGTFNFTVAVVDSSNPVQTVTKPLSITIASVPLASIWSSSSAPVRADGGPDNSVELGVRFRSDVTGTITAVRFYKSTANTGTHVGSLWSAAGTLLATATFTGETASGWQQVTFSSPVPITANTVYVASYHTTTGHFAADLNAFASAGVDNAPLHALANDVSGGNGVYAYAASTVFPSLSWSATNYWVDVVFQAGPPPALASISVTPSAPSILVGATQQFTATGTYSDGSTQNITSQVIWTSSATSSASISSAGLATGVSPGSSTITASLASVYNTAALTVQSAPLSIVTSSLSNGVLNSSYSASLSANGGTAPYDWAMAVGSLPPGLFLNGSAGVISGTPTTIGIYNFTIAIVDSTNPVQTLTKSFSIKVAAVLPVTIWAASAVPVRADAGSDNPVELGIKFRSDTAGTITGIRFYKSAANTGAHVANLWSSTGALLATATFTNETASGWQEISFSSPIAIAANTVYVASYHCNTGHFSADLGFFTSNVDNAPLHALSDSLAGGNGVFAYGANSTFPSQSWNASNYWVDVVFQQ